MPGAYNVKAEMEALRMAPRKQKKVGNAKVKSDLAPLDESVDSESRGFFALDDADLEAASKEIAADFEQSLKKTASEL